VSIDETREYHGMPDWSAFERESIDRAARHPRYEAPKAHELPPHSAQPEEE
jgi:hypothetical protein